MKTLYVSDMDGTLFQGGEPSLQESGRKIFTELLQSGVAVTVASGRNLCGIYDLAKECHLSLPVIAYNGGIIYDFAKKKALKLFALEKESTEKLLDVFEELGFPFKSCVFFQKEQRSVSFTQNGYQSSFQSEHQSKHETEIQYDEPIKAKTREELLSGDCLFVGAHGAQKDMNLLYERVKDIEGAHAVLHRSPYKPDLWFVDVGAASAGKGIAARYLKEVLQAEELVTFGDNHNDVPMLNMADRSYVVPTAPQEVQQKATAVLPDEQDCVLQFIKRETQK